MSFKLLGNRKEQLFFIQIQATVKKGLSHLNQSNETTWNKVSYLYKSSYTTIVIVLQN